MSRRSLDLIRRTPYAWLLALLTVVGEVWALLTFEPTATHSSFTIILLGLLALAAEVALVYAFIRRAQEKPAGLVDSVMTAISYIFQILVIKASLLIPLGAYLLVVIVLAAPMVSFPAMAVLLLAPALPLLLFTQLWTAFSLCGVFVQGYSVMEAVRHALQVIREHRGRIARSMWPFVLADLLLVLLLVAAGALSYDSAFIYTITPEMYTTTRELVDAGMLSPHARFTGPGDYFVLNRPVNGWLAAALGASGPDYAGIALYCTDGAAAAAIVILLGIPLLLLRTSTLARVYLDLAGPAPDAGDRARPVQTSRLAQIAEERKKNAGR